MPRLASMLFCALVFSLLAGGSAWGATADSYEPDNDNADDTTYAAGLPAPQPLGIEVAGPLSRGAAKVITPGTPHGPHSLHVGGAFNVVPRADRDFVKFSLTQASDIQLQTDSDIPFADTFLRVFDGNGRQIATNDDIDAGNGNYLSRINMTNLQAGTYYASVEQYALRWDNASVLDGYSLTLLTAATGQKFPPSIISPLRATGVAFAQFKYAITAVGSEPITFSASGFPTGLEVNGNTLRGIPTQTGTFNVTLTATGPGGTKTVTLELTINAFGIITTVAGNGNSRFSGDGGLAVEAELKDAVGVATDASGNFYIIDAEANRVRKVDGITGIITTVAGGGPADSVNDGVAATFAVVSNPIDVAVNGAGDIFFCDNNHNRIRKIAAATGVISTVAGNGSFGFSGDGGPASNAQLGSPWGVAADGNGIVYIADTNNHRVRKVDAAGKISTVAGNGTGSYTGDGAAATGATLNNPAGVAVNAGGDLFIADYSNNVVRKITAATGIITTVAGNGTPGYSGDTLAATAAQLQGPAGVALDGAGNILIADAQNNAVRKVTVATGIITTMAGDGTAGYAGDNGAATAAQLDTPYKVALDKSGNILISDTNNNVIRKVTVATGIITTVAGNGTNGLSGDGAAATAAMLGGPIGVGVDANGNMVLCDTWNNRLRRVSATGVITTISGGGQPGDGGLASAAALSSPTSVVADKTGNLYVADGDHCCVRRVEAATGIISTVVGTGIWNDSGDGGSALLATLSSPAGLAFDANGNLFIADQWNARVRKVNAATGVISTFAGNGTAAFSGDGAAATGASLNGPVGLAFDTSGNLFIMDTVNNCVRKVAAASGTISTVAGQGGTAGAFAGDGGAATAASLNTEWTQAGIAVDVSGNIYIADANNNRIRRVNAATGKIGTVVGNGVAEFSGDGGACNVAGLDWPMGVALDSANPANLFIADNMNARIRKVGVATPPVITSALTATGAINTLFSYRITASGHPAPVFSASDLPAGLVVQTTGIIIGIPTESGSFDVPLIAINASGKDEKTLRLTITNVARGANTAPAFASSGGGVSITVVPNPAKAGVLVSFVAPAATDAEGDKFTYTWDYGDGSATEGTGTQDTAQHTYAAAGLYTVVVTVRDWDSNLSSTASQRVAVNTTDVTESMIISKAQFKLDFSSDTSTKDSLGIAGIVPFRKTGVVSGSTIEAFIGGTLSRTYTLSSKGSGNGTGGKDDVFKLSAKTTSGTIDEAGLYVSGKFTMAIKKTNLKTDLSALGFVKGVTTSKPLKVPILLRVNGDSYLETVTVIYKSSEKSGSGAKLKEGGALPSR